MGRATELSFKRLTSGLPDMAIISPNDPKAMTQYVRECKEMGIPYIYDPSQQIVRLSDEDLREGIDDSHITIVNDYEFEMLRNRLQLDEAAMLACVGTLIITRGEEGSTILTHEMKYEVPAVLTARPVDPTGVGDAYRAGVLKGLALSLPWNVVGRMAALAATYVLENHGPQNHHYTREEFVQRYRTYFGDDALDRWK
jgi:adenosine kinase